jgi:hypothetical protein
MGKLSSTKKLTLATFQIKGKSNPQQPLDIDGQT